MELRETSMGAPGAFGEDRHTLNANDDILRRYEKRWRNTFFANIKPDESADIWAVRESARLQHVTTMLADKRETEDAQHKPVLGGAKDQFLDGYPQIPSFSVPITCLPWSAGFEYLCSFTA